MFTGMMWFDNNPKTTLADKVHQAAEYYRHKYGRTPDLCLVNPKMFPGNEIHPEPVEGRGGKILIRPLRSVLPGHIWIGVDEKLPTGAD